MRRLLTAAIAAGMLATAGVSAGEPVVPVLAWSAEQAAARACARSPELEAARAEAEAARASARGAYAAFWPKIDLEGSWRYVTEVPELSLELPGPMPSQVGPIEMGDHVQYAVGPRLDWTLWDSGARRHAWKASRSALAAQAARVESVRRDIVLDVRRTYVRAQTAAARLDVIDEALDLARAQARDIRRRAAAGSAARMDVIASRLEVADRERERLQAQEELILALRALLFRIRPEDVDDARPALAGTDAAASASVVIRLESPADSLAGVSAGSGAPSEGRLPQVEVLRHRSEAAEASAAAGRAGRGPRFQVFAKSSWEYPNLTVREEVWQNAAGVSAAWTLFDAGRIGRRAEEQAQQGHALRSRAEDLSKHLHLRREEARDRLARLEREADLLIRRVDDTRELARLTYAAYRAGRVNYLDVQTANLRALRARTEHTANLGARLMQFAVLENLAEEAAP